MVEETKAPNTQKNVQYYVELGKKIVMETKITGDVSQDNFLKGFSFIFLLTDKQLHSRPARSDRSDADLSHYG